MHWLFFKKGTELGVLESDNKYLFLRVAADDQEEQLSISKCAEEVGFYPDEDLDILIRPASGISLLKLSKAFHLYASLNEIEFRSIPVISKETAMTAVNEALHNERDVNASRVNVGSTPGEVDSLRVSSHTAITGDFFDAGSATSSDNPKARSKAGTRLRRESTKAAYNLDLFSSEKHTNAEPSESYRDGDGYERRITISGVDPRGSVTAKDYLAPTRGVDVTPSGVKQRLRANLAAIELLSSLNSDGRTVDSNDISVLAQYSGWGGLIDELSRPENWSNLVRLVGVKEANEIKDSSLTAYYTPASLVAAVWDLLTKNGWRGGRWLESAAGSGAFLAHRPAVPATDHHCTAVELEPRAALILKTLYPSSSVLHTAFELAPIEQNQFDLALGNFPFGEIPIYDARVGDSPAIHNYFLRHNLRMVKPGGVVAAITSQWTLDAKDSSFRKEVAETADLIGAVRLPSGVFSKAGTSVVSDLLIFQKRAEKQLRNGLPFVNLETGTFPATGDFAVVEGRSTKTYRFGEPVPIELNECFSAGAVIAGRALVSLDRFGSRCILEVSGSLDEAIKCIQTCEVALPAGSKLFGAVDYTAVTSPRLRKRVNVDRRPFCGSLIIQDELLCIVSDVVVDPDGTFSYTPIEADIPHRLQNAAKALVRLKKCALALITLEDGDCADDELDVRRLELNEIYDEIVQRHGYLHGVTLRRILKNDAEASILYGLERWNRKTKVAEKADIFSQRVIFPRKEATEAGCTKQAVAISLSKHGKLVPETISDLLGERFSAVVKSDDGNTILYDPLQREWKVRAAVLTGNVKQRLSDFQNHMMTMDSPEKEYVDVTIRELAKVIPQDIPITDIKLDLASRWMPEPTIPEFIRYLCQLKGVALKSVSIAWEEFATTPKVRIEPENYSATYGSLLDTVYGTKRMPLPDMLCRLAANVRPVVYSSSRSGGRVISREETLKAVVKADELQELFRDWVVQHKVLAHSIEKAYNDKFNCIHYEDFDVPEYEFPGMSPIWKLRPHQTNLVVRALLTGNTLAAHCVGAGKMFEKIALAHEAKRLGIAKKPCIAVPNHMLGEFAEKASSIFPSARVCLVSRSDLHKDRRRELMARVAMNNWDFVIITHSVLDKVSVPADFENRLVADAISALQDRIEKAKSEGKKISNRNATLRIKTLKNRLRATQDRTSAAADVLDMGQLGFDMLLVDESHTFKNLPLDTVSNDLGINVAGSQIAEKMYSKSLYLEHIRGAEDGLHFFSGTPISNSVAELYTNDRYLRRANLRGQGINSFDDWLAVYGSVTTELEVLPEGNGYHMKSRLNGFRNVPELLVAFRSYADVKMREDLNLPVPSFQEEVVVAKPTMAQSLFMGYLADRATLIRKRAATLFHENDNLLSVVTAGRQSALDIRLIAPDVPYEGGTKVALCAERMLKIYRDYSDTKACQAMFCDASSPVSKKSFNVYAELKRLLVDGGVPSDEIIFAQDYTTDEAKAEWQAKANRGEVRFVFCSTFTGGTGTNFQERLIAIHNLDAPWRPSDIEQRIGRGARQGNMFDQIFVVNYTTEGSFDIFLWDLIRRKANYISQIMRNPKSAGRELVESGDFDPSAVVAATTGSSVVREKTEVDARLVKLVRQEASFIAAKQSANRAWKEVEDVLPQLLVRRSAIKQYLQSVSARIIPCSSGHYDTQLELEEQFAFNAPPATWLCKKESAARLLKACESITGDDPVEVGSLFGQKIFVRRKRVYDDASREWLWDIGVENPETIVWRSGSGYPHHNLQAAFRALYEEVTFVHSRLTDRIAALEETKRNGRPLDSPFRHAEELKSLKIRQTELDAALAEELDGANDKPIVIGQTPWEQYLADLSSSLSSEYRLISNALN